MAAEEVRFIRGFLSQIADLPTVYPSHYVPYDNSVPEAVSLRSHLEFNDSSSGFGIKSESNNNSGSGTDGKDLGKPSSEGGQDTLLLSFKAAKSGLSAEVCVKTSEKFGDIKKKLCAIWELDPEATTMRFLFKGKALMDSKSGYHYRELTNCSLITTMISSSVPGSAGAPGSKKSPAAAAGGASSSLRSSSSGYLEKLAKNKQFWSDIRSVVSKHVSNLPQESLDSSTNSSQEETVTKIVNSFTHSLLDSSRN